MGACRVLDSNDPDDRLESVSMQSGDAEKKVSNCRFLVLDITAELLLPCICEVCEMPVKNIEMHSSLPSLLIYI